MAANGANIPSVWWTTTGTVIRETHQFTSKRNHVVGTSMRTAPSRLHLN